MFHMTVRQMLACGSSEILPKLHICSSRKNLISSDHRVINLFPVLQRHFRQYLETTQNETQLQWRRYGYQVYRQFSIKRKTCATLGFIYWCMFSIHYYRFQCKKKKTCWSLDILFIYTVYCIYYLTLQRHLFVANIPEQF